MPELKIGVQLRSLRLPLREAVIAAARMGAGAVEIDARQELRPAEFSQTARRQFRKLLEDLNLRVSAVTFYTRHGYQVAENLEARVEATRRALELAHALGAAVVVNQVGQVPASTEEPSWNVMRDVLSDLGSFGQRAGAILAAETGAESGADLRRLIEALPPGSLAVNLDPGGLIAGGFSPLEAVEQLGSHILHVHARDGVHDRAQRRGSEVALGRGQVEFPELLGALEEQGYRGWFTVVREQAADPEAEIAQAIKYLRSL